MNQGVLSSGGTMGKSAMPHLSLLPIAFGGIVHVRHRRGATIPELVEDQICKIYSDLFFVYCLLHIRK